MDRYKKSDIITLLKNLQTLFEVARLVNVGMTHQLDLSEDGTDLVEAEYNCYAVWNKEHRCENCVSALAYHIKGKMTKFEFVEGDVYYVVAKYIEVDDTPYLLEMVTKIDDKTLFGAYGKENFIQTIIGYNNTLYIDPLTKAYNRHYYDSQLSDLSNINAVAMVDVDHFKEVNDNFGHEAGDIVLSAIAGTLIKNVRSSDSVIRYGGDEFMILFEKMDTSTLSNKLESIRAAVESIALNEYPDIHPTISIGGVMCEKANKAAIMAADKNLYKAKQSRNHSVT